MSYIPNGEIKEMICLDFQHSLWFHENYPCFIENYPKTDGWEMRKGYNGKGIMKGSILGMDLSGYIRHRTKSGYYGILAIKLGKIAKKTLFEKELIYIPCKTNIFKNNHNATTKKLKRMLVSEIIDGIDYEKQDELSEKIVFGYDESLKRYFFVCSDNPSYYKIIHNMDKNNLVCMADNNDGIF